MSPPKLPLFTGKTPESNPTRWAAVLNSLSEGVVVSDLNGRVLEMNPAALALHGFASRAEAQRRLHDFRDQFELYLLDAQRTQLPLSEWPLARALRGEAFTDLEVELRRKDHSRIALISYSGTPVVHADGKVIACVLTLRDISAQKQAEHALRSSEAQLSAIVEHAAVGIRYLSLPERRILRVNEAFCQILGYQRGDLIGRRFDELCAPEEKSTGDQAFAELMAGRLSGFTLERQFLHRDGHAVWIRSTVSAIRDPTGQTPFAIAVDQDVTEARQADAARTEAERRLKMALDIAQLDTWEWDLGTRRLLISPSWRSKLGLADTPPERLAAAWGARIHPDDRERVRRHLQAYIAHPESEYHLEYRLHVGQGRYRWIASQALAVPDAMGRVGKLVGTHLDITERKEVEQRIREESLHDPLTGLPNRALFMEYGGHLLAAGARRHGRCALLFIDLDRFKPINDTFGHDTGDAVLREVAQRLLHCTRREDLVCRLGGDEFVILLPHIDPDRQRANTVAEHVLAVISRPIEINGTTLAVSPSIGISYYPEQGGDMDALLRMADLAMYAAKKSGRATFQEYSPELEVRAHDVQARESSVRAALQTGGFVLHYQPVIDLRTRRVVAAEALVRMLGDDPRETIAPREFVPVAELSGQIGALGDWVLRAACHQHEAWAREGLPRLTLAVNISPQQLPQPAFIEHLADIVARSGMDPGGLQIEVPERVMQGNGAVSDAFRALKALGVQIALDEFGSGGSYLSQLISLPIDRLKIAQNLTRRVTRDSQSETALRAIIGLGQILKVEVVGEGIESEDTLRTLRQLGCDQAQGFHLGRPMPAAAFADWCRRHAS